MGYWGSRRHAFGDCWFSRSQYGETSDGMGGGSTPVLGIQAPWPFPVRCVALNGSVAWKGSIPFLCLFLWASVALGVGTSDLRRLVLRLAHHVQDIQWVAFPWDARVQQAGKKIPVARHIQKIELVPPRRLGGMGRGNIPLPYGSKEWVRIGSVSMTWEGTAYPSFAFFFRHWLRQVLGPATCVGLPSD